MLINIPTPMPSSVAAFSCCCCCKYSARKQQKWHYAADATHATTAACTSWLGSTHTSPTNSTEMHEMVHLLSIHLERSSVRQHTIPAKYTRTYFAPIKGRCAEPPTKREATDKGGGFRFNIWCGSIRPPPPSSPQAQPLTLLLWNVC